MIDYEKSAELNGMEVEKLKAYFERYPGSGKRIFSICDNCGLERNTTFQNYGDLCQKCAMKQTKVREAARLKTIEQYSTQEARDEQSKRLKQYHKDNPDAADKMSKARIQYYEDYPEINKLISESVMQYHIDHPEKGRNHSEFMKQLYKDNPEFLERMTKMWREYWFNKTNRDIHSRRMLQYHKSNPKVGNIHSKFMIEYWNDPINCYIASKRMLQYHRDNSEWSDKQSLKLKQFHIDHPEAKESARLKAIEQWDNPEYRKIQSLKLKQYHIDHPEAAECMSARMQGISHEDWVGFSEGDWRNWDVVIYLNESFSGCHRHHITETIVVCIPGELHYHIRHNLKTGLNMGEMNALAIQFINGGL